MIDGKHYILKDGEPIAVPLMEWAQWYAVADRRVAETMVGDVRVSTEFLSFDYNFNGGNPILFETMIFGGEHDEYQENYSTREEAMRGHERAVAIVKGEDTP